MNETKREENSKIAAAALFYALPMESMQRWSPPPWMAIDDESIFRRSADLAVGAEGGPKAAFDRPRKSIFSSLKVHGRRGPETYHTPEPLSLREEVLFPRRNPPKTTRSLLRDRIWSPLAEELEELKHLTADPIAYLESAQTLLRRYTWNVPAPYDGREEISFYDFARLTAALSVCLKDRGENDPVTLLVGGDISGVQRFIYTITSKGAAGALRDRSFYLQLLTEGVARYILRSLSLPATNLLYVGGGGFTLLIPPASLSRLEEAEKQVDEVLLSHHAGDLYLAMAHVPLDEADFLPGAISDKWNALAVKHRKAKQRRFARLGKENLMRLFTPQEHGGNEEKLCQVCGREHPGTVQVETSVGSEIRKCPPCRSYEELGKALRRAGYLRLDEIPVQFRTGGPAGSYDEVLAAFGMAAHVAESVPPAAPGSIRSVVLALRDDAKGLLGVRTKAPIGRRYLVNVTPVISREDVDWAREKENGKSLLEAFTGNPIGAIKPFDFMAAQSEGIKRLGILRMDVDDMGEMFVGGFGEKATLAHIASLSFAMSLFFEGWVENLAREVDGGSSRIYSIYSGGDDLFFVGAWHLMPELARRIRIDLERYSGGHPGVHASGGIVLVQQKYPLAQSAEDAGMAEESAKSLPGKDAVCFLGRTFSWKTFGLDGDQDTVIAMKEKLAEMESPSLLRKLMVWQLMYEETVEERLKAGMPEEKIFWGPWMWQSAYFLRRMEEQQRREGNAALAEALKELREDKLGALHFPKNIEWIGVAARWAELTNR